MKNDAKLKGKDLINIGIYAAIYCVIMTAIAMLGFIPIMMPLLCVLVPLLGGIPMMLFMTKVSKFGMVTIYSIIVGLFLWITGMGYWPFIFGIVFGFLADLIAKSGSYKSSRKTILSYAVFCLVVFGNFIPLFINAEKYFETRQSFGDEYITSLSSIMSHTWLAPVLCVATLVCGLIGGFIGRAVLKKHFEKAGIA
ncbi:MAG: MptD family putative ECF transporter S component [Lachnospiraceae bacterium]|nr:MptD family putative ECF transporter S component [Lachnospiraceae bacterium]